MDEWKRGLLYLLMILLCENRKSPNYHVLHPSFSFFPILDRREEWVNEWIEQICRHLKVSTMVDWPHKFCVKITTWMLAMFSFWERLCFGSLSMVLSDRRAQILGFLFLSTGTLVTSSKLTRDIKSRCRKRCVGKKGKNSG